MTYFDFSTISTSRKMILLLAAFSLALSWSGILDRYSEEYIDGALISGGLIYATARGINAAVSLIQGTEITPAVATIAVGEVLDPINDLIERFSAVMLVALGSLALQKIFLEIFGHGGFSILLSAIAIALLVTATDARSRYFKNIVRLFAITVALRFALGIVVIASSFVDQVFLTENESAKHVDMTKLQSELQALSTAKTGSASPEEVAAAKGELTELRKIQSEQQKAVERSRLDLDKLQTELNNERSDVPLTCRLNPWCDEGDFVNAKKMEILAKESELNATESVQESTEASIKEKREYLKCASRQQSGQSCSFWGRAYSWVSPSAWVDRFTKVANKMDYHAANIISLLMSLVAKTIVIPLLFLFTFIQLYKVSIRKLLA